MNLDKQAQTFTLWREAFQNTVPQIVETLPEKLPKESLFYKILGFSLLFQYVDMCGDHV